MSLQDFEHSPPSPDGDPVGWALTDLYQKQEGFFQAAASWVQDTSQETLPLFMQAIDENSQSFKNALDVITEQEALDFSEQAQHIATIVGDADSKRVRFFRSIAPGVEFKENPLDHEELTELLENDLRNSCGDFNNFKNDVMTVYSANLTSDVGRLLGFVRSRDVIGLLKTVLKMDATGRDT